MLDLSPFASIPLSQKYFSEDLSLLNIEARFKCRKIPPLHLLLFLLLLAIPSQLSLARSTPETPIFDHVRLLSGKVEEFIAQGYHKSEILSPTIEGLIHDYPEAQSFVVGQSIGDILINGLKISSSKDKKRPGVVVLGGIHGDHALGHEIVLYLGAFLLHSYKNGHDKRVKDLIDSIDLFLIPTLNPDGFQIAKEGDCYSAKANSGRTNLANVDLDTDFKFHNYNDISAVLADNKLQKETRALLDWLVTMGKNVHLFVTLRTGLTGITYPYDELPGQMTEHTYIDPGSSTSPNAAPDKSLFEYIGNQIYYRHQLNPTGSKCNPLANNLTVIDGAQIGSTYGTLNDFLYEFTNTFPLNIYLDCCKYPKKESLESKWLQHANSLFALLEATKLGIRGTVTDKHTKKPIGNAKIKVKNLDKDVETSEEGKYWRPLPPQQKFDLRVEASGYKTKEILQVLGSNLNTMNGESTPVVIDLELESLIDSKTSTTSEQKSVTDAFKQESYHTEENLSLSPIDDLPPTSVMKPAALFHGVDAQIAKLDFKTPTELQKHHNYDEMTSELKKLAEKFPKISRLYEIGESVEKRKIWVLEISDKPGVHQLLKPEFRYIGNMHGNEVVGRELMLNLAKLLLENYDTNKLVTSLVNSTRIHLLPSMNPDGYERAEEGDCESGKGRENANDLDLNRNFPDRFFQTKDNQNRQPEVEAIMKWSEERQFTLGANLHGGSLVANYPYDGNEKKQSGQYEASPDDRLFVHLAKTYSTNHPTMSKGEHCFDICGNDKRSLLNERFTDGITNGAQWYVLYGGIQDWVYLHSNCFSITVELGCTKYPMAKDMNRYWSDNKKPLIKYMLEIHRGIYGVVTDQNSRPLGNATITIKGIDHDVHSLKSGDYWRLLLPNEYSVSVSKEGYRSAHRTVLVGHYGSPAVRVDFSLSSGPKELSTNVINGTGEVDLDGNSDEQVLKQNKYELVDGNEHGEEKKLEGSPTPGNKAFINLPLTDGSKLAQTTFNTKYMLALCFLFVLPGILLIVYLFGSTDSKRHPYRFGFSRLATGHAEELDGDDDDEGTRFMRRTGRGPKFTSLQDGPASDSEDELYSVDSWNK